MSKFLLLLGPSGAGKSTIIHELRDLDSRFIYISPYITRPLREGEKDKISITDEVMDTMDGKGEFLIINNLYDIRYATPRLPIIEAMEQKNFPILDWPISKMDIMTQAFPEDLLTVYIAPPTIEELRHRIKKDGRDTDGSRFRDAKAELKRYWAGEFDNYCDLKIVNQTGQTIEISQKIYSIYLKSTGEGNKPSKEQKA